MRPATLTAVVGSLLLAGCGGASRQTTVADCLNARGFLVTGSSRISGTSPAGTGLTLTVYGSARTARRAASKPANRGTQAVGRALVDARGNPGSGPPLGRSALAAVRACLAESGK